MRIAKVFEGQTKIWESAFAVNKPFVKARLGRIHRSAGKQIDVFASATSSGFEGGALMGDWTKANDCLSGQG